MIFSDFNKLNITFCGMMGAGKSLIGKKVKESLIVNTPSGEKNYEILSELKIPHESGTAVSLIEKQLFLLREENQKINKQMCELIEIARQNNELALRMHQLILTLMGDNNPSETFSLMYESLKKNFHADKAVIRLFINPGSIYISTIDEFIRNDSDEKFLFNDVLKKKVPMINAIDDEQQVFLFGKHGDSIKSSIAWC